MLKLDTLDQGEEEKTLTRFLPFSLHPSRMDVDGWVANRVTRVKGNGKVLTRL